MARIPLPSLPDGSDVLLDANVLVYALCDLSEQCTDLLLRCEREEISGFATVEIVNEACHRLMVAEAYSRGLISRPNASSLRGKSDVIKSLTEYPTQLDRVLSSNLLILDLETARLRLAQRARDQFGLMTNDSMLIAAAFALGIRSVA